MDNTKPKATPKDFFLWLGAVVTLYASIGALITLLFQYIDYAFPDPLQNYVDPFNTAISFAMASLIVLVPASVILFRLIRSDIARDPSRNEVWVRRWALVLTLFLAGALVIGDLIALINTFLNGDLTTRFILKVAVVLLVAGLAFFHFLADLRGYWNAHHARANMVGIAAGVLVLAAIVSGFLIIGSPSTQRLLRADQQKVGDLQTIQWQVVNYWQQKQKLPAVLTDLEDPISGFTVPTDRETGVAYEYRVTSSNAFELCATLNKKSIAQPANGSIAKPIMYGGIEGENWQHEEGRQCFERTIDPERYPPISKGR